MKMFADLWKRNFGNVPPVGHRLRENFPEQWVRFHALPNSKRYAESEIERKIILERGNTLANEIFTGSRTCWLFVSRLSDEDDIPHFRNAQRTVIEEYKLQKTFTWVDPFEESEDRLENWAYAKSMQWKMGRFDGLLTKRADDKIYNVLWVSPTSAEIFIPYDGGFDLILENKDRVNHLANKYSEWMSDSKGWL